MFAVVNPDSQLVYAPEIKIIMPTEYDNNSSQIPMAKRLKTFIKTFKYGILFEHIDQ